MNVTDPFPDQTNSWSAEFSQHEGWLRSVVAARSGEPQAVDEIMQEVAMAYVKQVASGSDPSSTRLRDRQKLAPWLYQVAVRQSLMYRRTHGRRRKFERRYADVLPHASSTDDDPLQWLLAQERRAGIRRGIHSLNPKDAELLLLKYHEDWTYRQIADHLGLTENAVETRLHRARKKLRQALIQMNVMEGSAAKTR